MQRERRFVVQQGGLVVFDRLTGLMWRPYHLDEGCSHISMPSEVPLGALVNEQAKAFAAKADHLAAEVLNTINDQRYAGYSDWRLPTRQEAESLLEGPKQSVSVEGFFHPPIVIDKLLGRVEAVWTCEHAGVQYYYDPDRSVFYPVDFLFVRP